MPRLTHRSREDLGHCSCPPLLFPLLLFPSHTNSPVPLASLSLAHALTLLSVSLSPQIGPAVHQPSCSSPSCLPSPNEKLHNNTGHRSRERTGCVHNGPVAPSKTIIPFFSSTLSPLLPGLEKTNLWRGGQRGGPLEQQPPRHLPLLTIAKRTTMINTRTHHLILSPHCLFTLPPCSLSSSRASMPFNTIIKVRTETFVIS